MSFGKQPGNLKTSSMDPSPIQTYYFWTKNDQTKKN